MSRPIKFRAWSKSEKSWIKDITTWIRRDADGNLSLAYPSSTAIQLIETPELIQFTGLHDKNGKEIWEGDILSCDGEKNVVRYSTVSAAFILDWYKGNGVKLDHFYALNEGTVHDYKILGNIYEHPALLTAKKGEE